MFCPDSISPSKFRCLSASTFFLSQPFTLCYCGGTCGWVESPEEETRPHCLLTQHWSIPCPWVHGQSLKKLLSISLVFSRATCQDHQSAILASVLHDIFKKSFMYNVTKKQLGRIRSMSWYHCTEENWPKGLQSSLACPRGTRRIVQPSAGTSKGWKTQAITLVLSFRLADVPGLRKPKSGLSGPQFRWKMSPALDFNLLRLFCRALDS